MIFKGNDWKDIMIPVEKDKQDTKKKKSYLTIMVPRNIYYSFLS